MYIIIAGGGRVGRQITERATRRHHDVIIIDTNEKICEQIYAETGALTINGNATDVNVLKEAGIEKADAAVALTGKDSDNLAFCLLAKQHEVEQIIGRVCESAYEDAYRLAGTTTTVQVTDMVVRQISNAIEQPQIQNLASLGSGEAEVVLLEVPEQAQTAGQTVEQITANQDFPRDCVFAGIYRPSTDVFIVPRGNEYIQPGDQIFLAAASADISKAGHYLLDTR